MFVPAQWNTGRHNAGSRCNTGRHKRRLPLVEPPAGTKVCRRADIAFNGRCRRGRRARDPDANVGDDMRRTLSSLVGILLLAPGVAAAGPFGGFSRDGSHYLADTTRVCQPVTGRQGMPRCQKKSADEVIRLGFRKGTAQRGASAAVQVQASGTRLVVRGEGAAVRAEWDSGNPIGSVGAVYLSDGGKLVAIEYEARLAGRSQPQVIVLQLAGAATAGQKSGQPASGQQTGRPVTGQPAAGGQPQPTTAAAPDDPKTTAQLRAADVLLSARKWKKAEEAYRALLSAGDHPAARYGLAAALAGQNRSTDAVAELVALARSAHPQAARWLVEARLGAHFARLQGDAAFRRAVGIDRDPARPPGAYERLVGFGGHWEQTGTPCQDPTVNLELDRKSDKFRLTIRTRCQGEDDTTRLAGTWRADGAAALRLTFPNVEGPEESLQCQLAAATDRSGEDTLSCTLEELQMKLRVVRR
jgi:hypothetical protein